MTEYKFHIKTSNNGLLDIPLCNGDILFVLGANGTGKSTLMQNFYSQHQNITKRILAHRQTWFNNNSMDMTAFQKKQNEENIKNYDTQILSRWKDDYSYIRSSISVFDLINSENIRARSIASAVDESNIELARMHSRIQAPIQAINELLETSNISIKISLGKDDQLFASKKGSVPYSIAELSDGERNALLICSDVLTADKDQIIIIDEPERHLHRSIISPLLSSLFQKRNDCIFVISTHDVVLPIDHSKSSVLFLRDCKWHGCEIIDWDADLLHNVDKIPSQIKTSILGSKRNILFVEGDNSSLDKQIYQLIYPNVTVISMGSCSQVEKSVEGIKGTEDLHWINAYGLIDADDRTPEQIQTLYAKGVVALECYSVEFLYYNTTIIKKIATRCAEFTGSDINELYEKAISEIIINIEQHKQRLCSRLCEKKVRNLIMKSFPKYNEIAIKEEYEIKFDLKNIFASEILFFEKLVYENDIDGLLGRYPVRETAVLTKIASGLGLTRGKYESAVRKLILDDKDILEYYRSILKKLSFLINQQENRLTYNPHN